MPTTQLPQIAKLPERCTMRDDSNQFLKKLNNYLHMLQTTIEMQNLLLPAFMSPELMERFKRTAQVYPDDWQAAFTKAYQKERHGHRRHRQKSGKIDGRDT